MARTLVLNIDGKDIPVSITKVDRGKLYGDIEIEAFDDKGKPAVLQVLDADGRTLIGVGGTSLATVDEDGNSVDRKKLIPINSDGDEIELVESSFNAPNKLNSATIEDYLSFAVKSVYLLEPGSEDTDLGPLEKALSGDKIYRFPFSYRGGLDYDTAFVIGNKEGVFMIIGTETELEFVKLNQVSVAEPIEEQEVSGEELDFDLF